MLSLVVARARRWGEGGGGGRSCRSASGLPSTTTREVLDREWEAEPDEEPVVG